MSMNDLTSDMLTRIRNAVRNKAKQVTVISNKLNRGVAGVLENEGYINGFECVDDGRQGLIRIDLKYGSRGERLINSVDRVSKGGCRVYRPVDDLPRPLQGLGIAIVSTSKGVMSDRRCREERIGGEVVATIC
ncbi:MAG: 30S ribosomal protein S8 [Planctomycetota bacterium]|nr:30S ribosomal protein S8 [Planctomycetota bacterium]